MKLSDKVSYTGLVSVKIVRDNYVVYEKQFHNKGTTKLFEYISKCVAGRFTAANELRPVKIKLFYNASDYPTDENAFPISDGSTPIIAPASRMISITSVPIVSQLEDGSYKTTLHFVIPQSAIFRASNVTDEMWKYPVVNQVCLYGLTQSADDAFSAYYFFTKETDNPNEAQSIIWDPQEFNLEQNSNYSLLIDWDLVFSN